MTDEEQPPSEFTTKLTPDQERDVLINFLGSTYGEVKKLEGFVISPSVSLNNKKSDTLKQQIHNVLLSKKAQEPVYRPPQPIVSDIQKEPVAVTVAAADPQPDINDNQLYFNFSPSEKDILWSKLDDLNTRLNVLTTLIDNISTKVSRILDNYLEPQPVEAIKNNMPEKKIL